MTNNIVIVGAGGMGRDTRWLIENINDAYQSANNDKKWNILGFVDDGVEVGAKIDDYCVIGGTDYLINYSEQIAVVCAIAKGNVRKIVVEKLKINSNLYFPSLIDPYSVMAGDSYLGEGCIVHVGAVFAVKAHCSDFCIVHLNSTIGHDTHLDSYVTVYPGVNVSGGVEIGRCTEIGTGSKIIQNIDIGEETIIGAGAVVINDIPKKCTAVGSPCKPVKFCE